MSPVLRGVDAAEHAPAAAVRRVLADGHVDAVLVEHRRGDDLAGADERAVVRCCPRCAACRRRGSGSACRRGTCSSGGLQSKDQTFLSGATPRRHSASGLEGVADAVAAAEEDQRLAADLAQRRATTTGRGTAACRSSRRPWPPAGRSACRARSGWGPAGTGRWSCDRSTPLEVHT